MEKALVEKIIKEELRKANESHLKMDVIIIASKCCPECDKINQKIITLTEATLNPPVPHPKCTRQWGCTCSIAFIPFRDENGRLIKK